MAKRTSRNVRKVKAREYLLKINRTCRYCGISLDQKSATLEHLIPKATGGANNLNNYDITCFDCNQNKGSMSDAEYMNLVSVFKNH